MSMTAMQTISGEIQSQTLNDNFSLIGQDFAAYKADTTQRAINVMSAPYNARGDGSDDSAAFQAAHDALPAYGGTLILPSPSNFYYLASAINITKRCRIVGVGKLACPIQTGATNTAFSARFSGGYLEFENLFISGGLTGSSGSAINFAGTIADHMSFIRIVNCYIKDFAAPVVGKYADHVYLQDVFYFQGVSGITTNACYKFSYGTSITLGNVKSTGSGATLPLRSLDIGSDTDTFMAINCNFYQTGSIHISDSEPNTFAPRYLYFSNVIVESGKTTGSDDNDSCYTIITGRDIRFVNCTALRGKQGYVIYGGTSVHIYGGTSYFNTANGIYLVNNTVDDLKICNVLITDNSQSGNGLQSGIFVPTGTSNFEISGCTIRSLFYASAGISQKYGVVIQASCSKFNFTNNYVSGSATLDLNFGGSYTNHSIANNYPSTQDIVRIGGKLHTFGTVAPSTGTWAVGDVCENTVPTLLKNISHWKCITAGTSGTWVAYGCGTGTTAQRPTLTANDAGYLYYDTTTTTKIFWTGTAWV